MRVVRPEGLPSCGAQGYETRGESASVAAPVHQGRPRAASPGLGNHRVERAGPIRRDGAGRTERRRSDSSACEAPAEVVAEVPHEVEAAPPEAAETSPAGEAAPPAAEVDTAQESDVKADEVAEEDSESKKRRRRSPW